jgi:hypothetical protein
VEQEFFERTSTILGIAGAMHGQAIVRQLESLGVKGSLLRSCVHHLKRHAVESLHGIWHLESTARKDQKKADADTFSMLYPDKTPIAGSQRNFIAWRKILYLETYFTPKFRPDKT